MKMQDLEKADESQVLNMMIDCVFDWEAKAGEMWSDYGGVPISPFNEWIQKDFLEFVSREYPDYLESYKTELEDAGFFDWVYIQNAGIYDDDGYFDDTKYEDNVRIMCHYILKKDMLSEFFEFIEQ